MYSLTSPFVFYWNAGSIEGFRIETAHVGCSCKVGFFHDAVKVFDEMTERTSS